MYFVIRQNDQGKFWWRAVADGNNEILAASELLEDIDSCWHAIRIVKDEADGALVYDRTNVVSKRGSV